MQHESEIREPLILGKKSYHQISEDISRPIEGKASKHWYMLLTAAVICFIWGLACLSYTIGTGIGVWGSNNGVDWAWDITNFVWWIGIGHAGTLDPFATGLLIVGVERDATKQLDTFKNLPKTYIAKIKLGAITNTYDSTGIITEKSNKRNFKTIYWPPRTNTTNALRQKSSWQKTL